MSTKDNFLTIKENGSHEIVIKKSRFIASLARTNTVEEANDFIKKISKEHHDATHNTFAYTIGLNDDQVKASDNGEPSGTAGIPELKALQLMRAAPGDPRRGAIPVELVSSQSFGDFPMFAVKAVDYVSRGVEDK